MPDLTRPVAVMCFSSGNGGMERSAVRLARFLSSITNVILVCKQGSFIESLYHEEDANYKCETVRFISRTFSPSMLVNAKSIISRNNISNVIFFGASELKTLHFSFIGKNLNLVVWHGTTKSRPKRDFFHNLIYSDVNYHVALSEHLLRNVRNIVPLTDGVEYKVIRPSFDFEVNSGDSRGGVIEQINITHVGRIAKGKGQVDAVNACKVLKDNNISFKLTLVGSEGNADYANEVKDAIKQNALESDVIMAGYVESVNKYLETTDILLFPSYGEGMPNAFIEALHYNIVCVAYDNTVFPEFIDMGFHVTLAKDRNFEDLADKLLTIAKNIDEEKKASNINSELAKEYFDVRRELEDWEQVLV